MYSSIPLVGMVHTVNIITYDGDADDGAGGVIRGAESIVYDNLKCRVASLDGEDKALPQGFDSANLMKVVAVYAPETKKGMSVRIAEGSKAALVCEAGTYRIVWLRHQIDDIYLCVCLQFQ